MLPILYLLTVFFISSYLYEEEIMLLFEVCLLSFAYKVLFCSLIETGRLLDVCIILQNNIIDRYLFLIDIYLDTTSSSSSRKERQVKSSKVLFYKRTIYKEDLLLQHSLSYSRYFVYRPNNKYSTI